MKSLFALKPAEIAEELKLEKSFQGKQIYSWLIRGAKSFDEMTDLSKSLRARLCSQMGSFYSTAVIDSQQDDDGAAKLALRLSDGNIIECVLLTNAEGELTACVSSQSGCAMGCRFCRTGTLKLKRNLEAFEIVEQFMQLQNIAPGKISHVVFMGIGEPFANIENVLKAIWFLHDPNGLNISHRRITVSTCGVVPGILELAKREVPVKLAVSLVTADNEKRSLLMPVNKTYPLETLRDALKKFQSVSGRRFTFEYCMIHDMNLTQEDANKLASFCKGMEVIVNLIPFNPCPELPFKTPFKEEINFFTGQLEKLGIDYTIRISRGRSIKGACGQLAAKFNSL